MKISAAWNRTKASYHDGKSFVNNSMDNSVKEMGDKVSQWLNAHEYCDEISRTNQLILDCKKLRQVCEGHSKNYLKGIKKSEYQRVQDYIKSQLDEIEGYIITLATLKDSSMDRDLALEKMILNSVSDRDQYLYASQYALSTLNLGKEDARKFAVNVARMKDKGATYLKDYESSRTYAGDPFKLNLSPYHARQFAFEVASKGSAYLENYKHAYHYAADVFGLDMTSPEASAFASETAKLGPEYLNNYKSSYEYATSIYGIRMDSTQARTFAEESAKLGPEYLSNYKASFEYANSFYGLQMPLTQARAFAADTAKLGSEYLNNYKSSYEYATSDSGLDMAPAQARDFAVETAKLGSQYLKKYKPAYEYASSPFGLRLYDFLARQFADEAARLEPEYLEIFKAVYETVNGAGNYYSRSAKQYADTFAKHYLSNPQHETNPNQGERFYKTKQPEPSHDYGSQRNQSKSNNKEPRPEARRPHNNTQQNTKQNHQQRQNPRYNQQQPRVNTSSASLSPDEKLIQSIKLKIPDGFKSYEPKDSDRQNLKKLEDILQIIGSKREDAGTRLNLLAGLREIVFGDTPNDELNKAYRKLALKFHPDKNASKSEVTTIAFGITKATYEFSTDIDLQKSIGLNVRF